jgi:hypothetical protein
VHRTVCSSRIGEHKQDKRLRHLTRGSSNHRKSILASTRCGCYYCCTLFEPADIEEWIDETEDGGRGQSALCPNCGIDAVIGDALGAPITIDVLKKLKSTQFGNA